VEIFHFDVISAVFLGHYKQAQYVHSRIYVQQRKIRSGKNYNNNKTLHIVIKISAQDRGYFLQRAALSIQLFSSQHQKLLDVTKVASEIKCNLLPVIHTVLPIVITYILICISLPD
jgi:hypothetical protein